jgi:L-cystine transport system substrate-binding protein
LAFNSAGEGATTKIRVGAGTDWQRYCYLDDDGNLAGYEYEVLRGLDELLPQYEFVYETYDFENILLALESGKVDIGAYQYEKNPERLKNFLFAEESYTSFIRYVVVIKDRNDIQSLDDLAGKKVHALAGDSAIYDFEQFNESHPDNPIQIEISNPSTDELIVGMTKGKWDAFSATKRNVEAYNEQYGDVFKIVGKPISTSFTYHVFRKGNTELQQAIDGALRQLKQSGKLAEISIKELGGDYTEDE